MAPDKASDGQNIIERRYNLGGLLIREQLFKGRWRRAWSKWREASYLDRHFKMQQFHGEAIMYKNVLLLKPWRGCKDDDKLFKNMEACERYLAGLPAWDKTEYVCQQKTQYDRGTVYRCSDGKEMEYEVIERDCRQVESTGAS